MSALRVCIVNNITAPYMHRVFAAVAARGAWHLQVLSCARSEPGRGWALPAQPGYEQRLLDGWRLHLGGSRNVYFDPAVGRALADLAPDALMLAGFTPTMLLAARYARRSGIPYGVMVDAWSSQDLGRVSWLHRQVRRSMVASARSGAGASRKSVELLRHYGLAIDACRVVPLVPAWDAPAASPGWAERPYDLLWSGTVNDSPKGVRFFAEVVGWLVRAGRMPRVRVTGAGPLLGWLRGELDRFGVEAPWFDGYLEQAALADAYSSARLLLFPTRRDAWGLVANEALQCGTPVIVSPHAGCAGELVRDDVNGAVLERDTTLWGAWIDAVLADRARWERYSAAARRSAAEVSVAASAAQLEAVFELLTRP